MVESVFPVLVIRVVFVVIFFSIPFLHNVDLGLVVIGIGVEEANLDVLPIDRRV